MVELAGLHAAHIFPVARQARWNANSYATWISDTSPGLNDEPPLLEGTGRRYRGFILGCLRHCYGEEAWLLCVLIY
ncbi:hypothetical protein M430DRAFT_185474 [Amorphotheca resinae ATCC 22711]|uniref:Uncharacterized protein n=1 Tax=Amorphotheca resinae ATCC 22711 TaxID=857342 RepID=A0A2T3ASG8_AMORE|nr:hypothetical protein M430DRAFT_185474 [Amorphotheca resinae ATCC 22711]PSS09320.1 hypothetical protein M430DRAFT_185474 [Amorphotheca resinae ATCC 22711]